MILRERERRSEMKKKDRDRECVCLLREDRDSKFSDGQMIAEIINDIVFRHPY